MQAQSPQKGPKPQLETPTATLADKPAAPTPAEEIPMAPPGPLTTDVLSLGMTVRPSSFWHLLLTGIHSKAARSDACCQWLFSVQHVFEVD